MFLVQLVATPFAAHVLYTPGTWREKKDVRSGHVSISISVHLESLVWVLHYCGFHHGFHAVKLIWKHSFLNEKVLRDLAKYMHFFSKFFFFMSLPGLRRKKHKKRKEIFLEMQQCVKGNGLLVIVKM